MATGRREAAAPHLLAFGNRIRELRLQAGMTQETLANKANLQTAALSLIESGQRDPQISVLWLLAEALKVSPERLVVDPEAGS